MTATQVCSAWVTKMAILFAPDNAAQDAQWDGLAKRFVLGVVNAPKFVSKTKMTRWDEASSVTLVMRDTIARLASALATATKPFVRRLAVEMKIAPKALNAPHRVMEAVPVCPQAVRAMVKHLGMAQTAR